MSVYYVILCIWMREGLGVFVIGIGGKGKAELVSDRHGWDGRALT